MVQVTEKNISRTRRNSAQSFSLDPAKHRYTYLSQRPLHVLVFLLPLIAVFEVGIANPHTTQDIRARKVLSEFFDWFGAGGLHVPAILTVVVLLLWHILSADRWRIRGRVLAGMAFESAAWTAPLLVLGLILARMLGVTPASPGPAAMGLLGAEAAPAASSLPDWFVPLSMALGAGVYEEVLFRLVGIALVHIAVVDVGGLSDFWGKVIGVVVTAALFAGYHDISASGSIDWGLAVFFFAAGVYFGVVFLARGLGIAVGVHALYDVVVLMQPLG
jgi:membrane protease YdiL (CAAX protease family)